MAAAAASRVFFTMSLQKKGYVQLSRSLSGIQENMTRNVRIKENIIVVLRRTRGYSAKGRTSLVR